MEVLSIQSHVCFGYVGNRAASFPLQRMGFDVNAVNTVQFSNHTGYGTWTGEILRANHLESLLEGLQARGVFARSEALLSGYLGSTDLGACLLTAAHQIKASNPSSIYLCDPVMGDVGRGFFVKPEIPDYFINQIIPKADIITPNHFEFNRIVGREITQFSQLAVALDEVHAKGPSLVVITSFIEDASDRSLKVILSTRQGQRFYVESPLFDFVIPPNGTGDLFSALFLGNYLLNKKQHPEIALQRATGGIYKVLQTNVSKGTRELEIIAAQDAFLNPEIFKIQSF